jgi:hypothetical protein
LAVKKECGDLKRQLETCVAEAVKTAERAEQWRECAEGLANLIKRMNFGDTFPAITEALADFEEASK